MVKKIVLEVRRVAEEGLDDVSVAGEATIEPILTPTKLRYRGLNPLSQRALHSLSPTLFWLAGFRLPSTTN